MTTRFYIYFLVLLLACNTSSKKDAINTVVTTEAFSIRDFDALSNRGNKEETLLKMELDYTDAIRDGFVIPSVRQSKEGVFVCTFSLKNNLSKAANFCYKIFYQNESYKINEWDSVKNKESEFAYENFYGSWENTDVAFKTISQVPADGEFHMFADSIRIVGNPRNESIYFSEGRNDRWKRNPRVGQYSFVLVVTTEENIFSKKIPEYIQHINQKNGSTFSNPYSYFMHGEGKNLKNVASKMSLTGLKVIAKPDLGSGIYADPTRFEADIKGMSFSNTCGADSATYYKAAFSQFINYINETMRLENIPVIKDVLNDNYTKKEYRYNESFFKREELISTTPTVAKLPCETVYSDPAAKKIVIKNPKSEYGKWKKESVGVISRHAFTYGKWRVKCKLTELLNRDNVWNGLTNALWLIGQSGPGSEEWNKRRVCSNVGYMETYWGGKDDKRVPAIAYSEIDFEIIKTPPYCPDQFFPPVLKNPRPNQHNVKDWNVSFPDDMIEFDDKLSVSCTNWDMACPEPKNFGVGCNPITYGDKTFETHRWDHWYRAVASRTPEYDDTLFGSPFYYFEIEWKPDEIIWRIGPQADNMRVVGYMNNTITSIPNNQMVLIITQEWHNTNWWPGSPYLQHFIPFPKNDIVGEIYELTIE